MFISGASLYMYILYIYIYRIYRLMHALYYRKQKINVISEKLIIIV